MNSRERVLTAVNHREPDRVPITFDAQPEVYEVLYRHFGIDNRGALWDALHVDTWLEGPVVNDPREKKLSEGLFQNRWGYRTKLQPYTVGDKTGYYEEIVYHPLADVQSIHELEQYPFYTPIDQATLDDLHARAKHLYETTEYALMLNGAGSLYEWAQTLRGWDVFMMDLAGDPAFAGALLAKLADAHIRRMEQVLPAVEGYIQAIQVGDDLGMQSGPQISPRLYRKVVKPWHKELYQYIHQHTDAKLFLHTCGSVYAFIPDLIEIGVDILNPVQVSAKDMDTRQLKREFGKDITFWGGGCDTQHVLPFGTPAEVKDEVKRRIDDLAPGGGFVFTQVHNIQAGVPVENIVAMYEAVQEFGHY